MSYFYEYVLVALVYSAVDIDFFNYSTSDAFSWLYFIVELLSIIELLHAE